MRDEELARAHFPKETVELASLLRMSYLCGHQSTDFRKANGSPEMVDWSKYDDRGLLSWWCYVARGLITLGGLPSVGENPQQPMKPLFGKIEAKPADIWAVTKELSKP